MTEKLEVAIFWFRRDLRLHDNAGFYHALKGDFPVLPIFIFDTDILSKLTNKTDARVSFIHKLISDLHESLKEHHASIDVRLGKPIEVFKTLLSKYTIKAVYTNHDYEPYAVKRDDLVRFLLTDYSIPFHTFKDHVIFEKNELLSGTETPYKVYTPYKNKWLAKVNEFYLKAYPSFTYLNHLVRIPPLPLPTLADLGFSPSAIKIPSSVIPQGIVKKYHEQRNFPSIEGTSRLGIHFRFGSISIREKAKKATMLNEVWLSELIWRDFFSQLMYHFPHVIGDSFNAKFNKVTWRTNEADFKRWCEGTTGYPLVDAGMRELNATGHMHNRVRMVVASFLTKHLFIDWRWGEAYFAEKLLDFDLASNNGNWQWSAGTGADAQPYFRIFNPTAQQQKFDADFSYVKKWVPEYGTIKYPIPMIDHKLAVARAKEAFLVLAN